MKRNIGGVFIKALMAVSCFALAGVMLASCGKGNSGAVVDNPKEIHIRVWESDDGPNTFIKEAGKEFTKLHPNIVIDFIHMSHRDAPSAIERDGPLGIGPDLFAAPHDQLGILVSKGLVLPAENPDYVRQSVLGACSKGVSYNGTLYGYPVSAETYALFYNKKLINENEVPKTWEDLVVWVDDFCNKNPDKKGFTMDFSNGYYGIIFATGNNNRLFGESGTDASHPNVNTEAAIKGYTFMQTLRKSLHLTDINTDGGTGDGLFASGHCAMYVTGPWNIKNFEEAGVDFGIAPLPSLPGESLPAASFSGVRCMFVNSYSRHPKEAAMFGEFLLTPEMQQLRFKHTGAIPSINTTVDSKYMAGFLKQLDYAFPMPSIPEMGTFWGEMGGAIWRIWNGEDVKTVLDDCASKFKK